jgi:cell fate regulator YaaT (PSP1 superfamily)
MNRDDRIDEEREERRDDEPEQATVEAADRGQEDTPADAETVDAPGAGSEGQSKRVARREEEAPAYEQPFESSFAAGVAPAMEHGPDEPDDDAGSADHVVEATSSQPHPAEASSPEDVAHTAESPTYDTVGQETGAVDAGLPGAPPAKDASSRAAEDDTGEPRFSELQGAAGAREAEEGLRPRVVIAAGTDEQSLRAVEICREKARQLHVRMHPLGARYNGDRHITIFFRSDDKVDFRKLVRELSRVLHARIEMRQLGPREQGKLCGLVGKCGYPLCCRTFLGQFTQSSIRMAKTQDLALNPLKISGVCGRLLCCLNYEQELYAEVKSRMPKVNKQVDTEFGPGRVSSLNVLKETVTVQFETMTRELPLDQVRRLEPQG